MELPKRVTLEEQLAVFADMGIALNDGVTNDDLMIFEDRNELESRPYSGLVEVLGHEIMRDPYTPKCNLLWMCDYERIEDHGDYKSVLERLELMTDRALGLRNIKDHVDIEEGKAWVEFNYRGTTVHWDAKVDDDWLDHFILVKYDALLKESSSAVRIYSNHIDYGQVTFFAAFTSKQKAKFDEVCKIPLTLIEKQR